MNNILKIISVLVLVLFFSTSYAFGISNSIGDKCQMPCSRFHIRDIEDNVNPRLENLNALEELDPGTYNYCPEGEDCSKEENLIPVRVFDATE